MRGNKGIGRTIGNGTDEDPCQIRTLVPQVRGGFLRCPRYSGGTEVSENSRTRILLCAHMLGQSSTSTRLVTAQLAGAKARRGRRKWLLQR